MKSNLFVFSSVASSFGVISKNLLLNSRSWRYDLMFSYKSFIVLALTFKSLIHFELIFLIWHNIGTELHSFAFGYLSLHLLEKKKNDWMVLVLLSKNHLTKKTKSFDHKYMSLFLGSQICYTNLYIYPCAITTLSWLQFLCSKFWNQCYLPYKQAKEEKLHDHTN